MWAQWRTADQDGAAGAVPALEPIVAAIRQRSPRARILVRADAGFCREELLAWCEAQPAVYYGVGLAKNSVLVERLAPALADARARRCLCGAASARRFTALEYRTVKSWSRTRRVIGKAEVSAAGDHPRFVVTNLPAEGFADDSDPTRFEPARLDEEFYGARGAMENVLQQQVLDLAADRLSTHWLASNPLRLWLATLAYLLLERVRALGCAGTDLARATAGSVRRVWGQRSRAWAWQEEDRACQRRLAEWSAHGADG